MNIYLNTTTWKKGTQVSNIFKLDVTWIFQRQLKVPSYYTYQNQFIFPIKNKSFTIMTNPSDPTYQYYPRYSKNIHFYSSDHYPHLKRTTLPFLCSWIRSRIRLPPRASCKRKLKRLDSTVTVN